MNHRIVERKKIKKGLYSYTSYKGLGDFIATKGLIAIIELPFILIFYFYKYLFLGCYWIIKKIIELIKNLTNKNEIKKSN